MSMEVRHGDKGESEGSNGISLGSRGRAAWGRQHVVGTRKEGKDFKAATTQDATLGAATCMQANFTSASSQGHLALAASCAYKISRVYRIANCKGRSTRSEWR